MKIQAFDIQKSSVFNSPKGKNEKKYLEGMESDYPGIGAWVEGMLAGRPEEEREGGLEGKLAGGPEGSSGSHGGMKKLSMRNRGGHTVTAYTAAGEAAVSTTVPVADPADTEGSQAKAESQGAQRGQAVRTVVILLHGYNGCAMQMMPYARIYLELPGFAVLLPNFENHGESEGDKTQFGWQEKHDVDLWIKEAQKLYPEAADRIILHGVSMGGATSMLCSRHKSVVAVIDDCGYSALPAQIHHESELAGMRPLPFTFMFSLANFARAGWFLGQVRPIRTVRFSTVPILFIHGTLDKKVPSWMAQKLYQSKIRGPKSLWLAPDATHAKSLLKYPDEYREKVVAFLKENGLV